MDYNSLEHLEKYAIGSVEERDKIMQEKSSATIAHVYFQALHHLQRGKRADAEQCLMNLRKMAYNHEYTNEVEALLHLHAWPEDRKKTLDYLNQQLKPQLEHEPPPSFVPSQSDSSAWSAPELPSSWPADKYSLDALVAEAQKSTSTTRSQFLDMFEPGMFPYLASKTDLELDTEARLKMLHRVAPFPLPGAVDIIASALLNKEQAANMQEEFNALPLDQLKQLAEVIPALKQQQVWQRIVVSKIQGTMLDTDNVESMKPEGKVKALDAVGAFLQELADQGVRATSFAWLTRRLAFARLSLQIKQGAVEVPVLAACMEAAALFQQDWVVPRSMAVANQIRPEDCQSSAGPFIPAMSSQANNSQLVQQALKMVAYASEDPEALFRIGGPLSVGLMPTVEMRILAEVMLTGGRLDPQKQGHWVEQLNNAGGDFQALQDRIDLEIIDPLPDVTAKLDTPIVLHLSVKNVPLVEVKVFELQTWGFYKTTGDSLSLSIDLDGVSATHEWSFAVQESPLRVVQRVVELPQLTGRRGTFVVEVVGAGKRSRAMLTRGTISYVSRICAAGYAFSLFYEDNTPVEGARIWLDNHEFTESSTGEVIIPFSPDNSRRVSLIFGDAHGFAAKETSFKQKPEEYVFRAIFHFEPESIAPHRPSPLIVYPTLTLYDNLAPLALVSNVSLNVSITDEDGLKHDTTTTDFDISNETKAAVHNIIFPERAVQMEVRLTARVALSRTEADGSPAYQQVSVQLSWQFGGANRTEGYGQFYVSADGSGNYIVRLLGRAGEAIAGRSVRVQAQHSLYRSPLTASLMTDSTGSVNLGPLSGITQINLEDVGPGAKHSSMLYNLPKNGRGPKWPQMLILMPGEEAFLPYPWVDPGATLQTEGVAMLEICSDRDEVLSHVDGSMVLEPGRLRILGNLKAGMYRLMSVKKNDLMKDVLIKVVDKDVTVVQRGVTTSLLLPNYVMEDMRPRNGLQIASVEADTSKGITVQLSGSSDQITEATVLIEILRFLPLSAPYLAPETPGRKPHERQTPQCLVQSGVSMGDELRYVLERRKLEKEGRFRPGVFLDKPSLLMVPRLSKDTNTRNELAAEAEMFTKSRARISGELECGYTTQDADMHFCGMLSRVSASVSMHLGFCPRAMVLPNLTPNANGLVTLSLEQLAAAGADLATYGATFCQVTAIRAGGGPITTATVPITGTPPLHTATLVTTMLERPFPAGTPASEESACTALAVSSDLVIPDATSAQITLYGTVQKVWTLMGALLALNPDSWSDTDSYKTFSFLGTWNTLTEAKKASLLSEHACTELYVFTKFRDPPFFKAAVLPLLSGKLSSERSFLDEWMLGLGGAELVAKWQMPHRYKKLSAFERCILASMCDGFEVGEDAFVQLSPEAGSAAAILARDMRFKARLQWTFQRDSLRKRFEIALAGNREEMKQMEARKAVNWNEQSGRGRGPNEESGPFYHPQPPSYNATAYASGGPSGSTFGAVMPTASPPAPGRGGGFGAVNFGAVMPRGERLMSVGNAAEQQMDLLREVKQKKQVYVPAFQSTKEWVEAGWNKRKRDEYVEPPKIAPDSLFWADYAEHLAKGESTPFLSKHLAHTATSFTEAVLALAVLGVPWVEEEHLVVNRGGTLVMTAASPFIAFSKQTNASDASTLVPSSNVVLLQRILDPSEKQAVNMDEEEESSGQRPVSGPLLCGRVYMLQVLVASHTEKNLVLDLTMQAPQGSVVLNRHPAVWTSTVSLSSFMLASTQLYFYFPGPGTFANFPASLSRRGKLLSVATDVLLHLEVCTVLPPRVVNAAQGPQSWREICAGSGPEAEAAIIEYLRSGDLTLAELHQIYWRCRQEKFFLAATAALRQRNVWDMTMWAYSLRHGDEETLREFLLMQSRFLDSLGPYVSTRLLTKSTVDAGYVHREYFPLINARAHVLGSQREVLNQELKSQWKKLLQVLVRKEPSSEELVQVMYYLILQDRYEEAEALLPRLDPETPENPAPAPVLYLKAWLALESGGDWAKLAASATEQAARFKDNRWSRKFQELAELCQELSQGIAHTPGQAPTRVPLLSAPALKLRAGDKPREVVLECDNVEEVTLSAYLVDAEILFSRRPFSSQATEAAGNFSFLKPPLSTTIKPEGTGLRTLTLNLDTLFPALPAGHTALWLEASAEGLSCSLTTYACDIVATVYEAAGYVVVSQRSTGRPVSAAYVKVFSRANNGTVAFHKDGYTDRRGAFDIFKLTCPPTSISRLAIMAGSRELGVSVVEAKPPSH